MHLKEDKENERIEQQEYLVAKEELKRQKDDKLRKKELVCYKHRLPDSQIWAGERELEPGFHCSPLEL